MGAETPDLPGPRDEPRVIATEIDFDRPFLVGEHRVDPQHREVWLDSQVVVIGPTDLAVLQKLARSHGQVVSKDELIAAVWGKRFVGEHVLTNAIHELRKAFGDVPRKAKVIRTVHRRGYELVADVRPVDVAEPGARLRSWLPWLMPALFLVALAAVPFGLRFAPRRLLVDPVEVRFAVVEAEQVLQDPEQQALRDDRRRRIEDLGHELLIQADGLSLQRSDAGDPARATIKVIVGDQIVQIECQLDGVSFPMTTAPLTWEWPAIAQSLFASVLVLDLQVSGEQDLLPTMLEGGAISREAFRHRALGDEALDRRESVLAITHFDQALAADEHDPMTLESRANYRELHLQLPAAMEDLRHAAAAAERRGVELTDRDLLEARTAKLGSDFAAARLSIGRCIGLRPYSKRCQFASAWQLAIRERNCREALDGYERLAAGDRAGARAGLPGDFDAHMAEAQLLCGQVAAAEASLQRFARMEPAGESADLQSTWAWFYLLTGRPELAEEALDRLDQIAPYFVRRESDRGNLALARGELEAAGQWFARAGRPGMERDQIAAKVRLAAVAILARDASTAIQRAREALSIVDRLLESAEADALLSDQVLPIRGLLGLALLAGGEGTAARRELDHLEQVVALRRSRNDDQPNANRYREEYVHLLAGCLDASDGRLQDAQSAYERMLAVLPYDDPFFVSFVTLLAGREVALQPAAATMANHLGWHQSD